MATLAELCGALPWAGGLLPGLFLAGAAGSVMHCVPMCGGFVLGQTADRMARLPATHLCEWRRFSAGALLPYHLGRMTMYAGLGAVAGAMLGWLPGFGVVSPLVLAVGAMLFMLHAAHRLLPAQRFLPALDHAPAGWARVVSWFARHVGGSAYPLGVALGFLPCGLLYAALTTAAAGGSPLLGAAAMLAFGLGTVPALVAVGIGGQAAGRRWQHGIRAAAPAVMLLNATVLGAVALRGFIIEL